MKLMACRCAGAEDTNRADNILQLHLPGALSYLYSYCFIVWAAFAYNDNISKLRGRFKWNFYNVGKNCRDVAITRTHF